jgi:hypothetical protein
MTFWQAHSDAVLAVAISHGALLVVAIISTMPPPDQPFRVYPWIYNCLHLFLNLTTAGRSTVTAVQSPDGSTMKKVETQGPTPPKETL